ncbi:MAG: GNAT family N-acetyltransferase [Chitinophagaceae bacterium]|nr:GNAT family N-acetyltransferase [Chitinophagaceae bacterium]
MTNLGLNYKIGSASEDEIKSHLLKCSAYFYPPLHEKIDIQAYSKKINRHSVTFEAWDGNDLVGLVAAYLNDLESRSGFITNVSVVASYMGRGIASELLDICVQYSKEKGFNEIKLEVQERNTPAIFLYTKKNFIEVKNEAGTILMINKA